jgi:multimeric flavodoxin WrbA
MGVGCQVPGAGVSAFQCRNERKFNAETGKWYNARKSYQERCSVKVLAISGSRDPEGQTAAAVGAVLKGARSAGCEVEVIYLPSMTIERCRQCDADGWGLCRREGRCVIEDDLARVVDKIEGADAVIFATPVYFSDLSESLRAFLDRLRRISLNEKASYGLEGKPVVGICVAGGGGGGAPACAANLDRILSIIRFDVVDMALARRQNLEAKLPGLRLMGKWLASAGSSG